jgi:hypothetical protein
MSVERVDYYSYDEYQQALQQEEWDARAAQEAMWEDERAADEQAQAELEAQGQAEAEAQAEADAGDTEGE